MRQFTLIFLKKKLFWYWLKTETFIFKKWLDYAVINAFIFRDDYYIYLLDNHLYKQSYLKISLHLKI